MMNSIDWSALGRLRTAFLNGTAGRTDYWLSETDLASYDATFAQRIGWKWDYVLAELSRRGWSPAAGPLLDWGCGSGIAHRAFLDHFRSGAVSELRLWDRSPLAVRFALDCATRKYPGLKVVAESPASRSGPGMLPRADSATAAGSPAHQTLLISHVVTELEAAPTEALVEFAAGFTSVLWVEPGTHECSLRLIGIRERLRGRMNVVAPCTHQAACGMLAPCNGKHWCHHFAAPPPEVFTNRDWAKFAELAGVDLRSLPLSFLVLDRRPVPTLPEGTVRVVGRPRLRKGYAQMLGCDASGVSEKRLMKRNAPEFFRQMSRGHCAPLQQWRSDQKEILEAHASAGTA